jgi:hypothetical protein
MKQTGWRLPGSRRLRNISFHDTRKLVPHRIYSEGGRRIEPVRALIILLSHLLSSCEEAATWAADPPRPTSAKSNVCPTGVALADCQLALSKLKLTVSRGDPTN